MGKFAVGARARFARSLMVSRMGLADRDLKGEPGRVVDANEFGSLRWLPDDELMRPMWGGDGTWGVVAADLEPEGRAYAVWWSR